MLNKAVITGDVINSSLLSIEDKIWLNKTIGNALETWGNDFALKSEQYRGDSFQCLVNQPVNSLRLAIIIKTFIKSLNKNNSLPLKIVYDLRLAIGIGEIEAPMKNISTSDGEAYRISGRLLDNMKKNKQNFAIGTNDSYHNELETEIFVLDHLLLKASPLQCEVIYLKLLDYTEIEISNNLKIKQSAVNQRANNASWQIIDKIIKRFEKIYSL